MSELTPFEDFQNLEEIDALDPSGLLPEERAKLDEFRKNPPTGPTIEGELGQLEDQNSLLDQLGPPPEKVEESDGRSFFSLAANTAFEIGGSVAGVMSGRAKPAQKGISALANLLKGKPVTRSAIGSASGEALFQSLQRVAPESFNLGNAPQTAEEALGKISLSGSSDLIFGTGATMLKRGFDKFSPFNKVSDEALETIEFLEREVGSENIPISMLLPESKGAAAGENFAEGSFASSNKFKNQRMTIDQALTAGLKHQANRVASGTPEQISKNIVKMLKKETTAQNKALHDIATRIQMMIKSRGESFSVDIAKPLKFIRDNFDDTIKGLKETKTMKFLKNFEDAVSGKIDFGKFKTLEFRKVQSIINDISDDISSLNKKSSLIGADRATTLRNDLVSLRTKLNNSLIGRIKGIGDPELAKEFRLMQNITFNGSARFNEKLLTQIINSDDTAATIVMNTIKSPKQMRRLKHLLGPEWRRMEGLQYQDLIRKSTSRKGGVQKLDADSMLDKLDKMDPERVRILFNHNSLKKFKQFAEVLAKTQGDKVSNVGTVFIELAQAGAVTSMLFGGPTGANTLILLGPMMFEKLFTKPRVIDKMIELIKADKTGTLSNKGAVISGILSDLSKAGIDYMVADSPTMQAQRASDEALNELKQRGANTQID